VGEDTAALVLDDACCKTFLCAWPLAKNQFGRETPKFEFYESWPASPRSVDREGRTGPYAPDQGRIRRNRGFVDCGVTDLARSDSEGNARLSHRAAFIVESQAWLTDLHL